MIFKILFIASVFILSGCALVDPSHPMHSPLLVASHAIAPSSSCEGTEINDYVEQMDPTTQFQSLTEQLAAELGIKEIIKTYSDCPKWVLTFNEIPGDPPYSLQEKRISRSNPEVFELITDSLQYSDILKAKKLGKPVSIVMGAYGYLPGEKVTWRLASKDKNVFKEIICCPRPLILRRPSGEVFMKGFLESYNEVCGLSLTTYCLDLSSIGDEESYRFIGYSGNEKMEQVLKGPVIMRVTPDTMGAKGGMAELQFHLEDGSIHKMEIPWGEELLKYNNGDK